MDWIKQTLGLTIVFLIVALFAFGLVWGFIVLIDDWIDTIGFIVLTFCWSFFRGLYRHIEPALRRETH